MANSSQTTSNSGSGGAKKVDAPSAATRVRSVDPVRSPIAAALEEHTNNDPNFEERYVRNDPIRMQQVKMLGYEAVKDQEGNTEQLGNLVLMRVPREKYEERRGMIEDRTAEITNAPREGFKTAARQTGAKTEDTSRSSVGRTDD